MMTSAVYGKGTFGGSGVFTRHTWERIAAECVAPATRWCLIRGHAHLQVYATGGGLGYCALFQLCEVVNHHTAIQIV